MVVPWVYGVKLRIETGYPCIPAHVLKPSQYAAGGRKQSGAMNSRFSACGYDRRRSADQRGERSGSRIGQPTRQVWGYLSRTAPGSVAIGAIVAPSLYGHYSAPPTWCRRAC